MKSLRHDTIINLDSVFPLDIWKEIIPFCISHFKIIACVSKQFTLLAKDTACFGEKDWLFYGGNPGLQPVIPVEIYNEFDPSKHLLTLIPETINDEPVTLTSIDRFVRNIKKINRSNYINLDSRNIHDKTAEGSKSHWVLLFKNILEESKNQHFKIQDYCVEKMGCEIPNLIDVVVSLLMHNLKTGEFVYPDTATRIKETNVNADRIAVGKFSRFGLHIWKYISVDETIGAACSKKSP